MKYQLQTKRFGSGQHGDAGWEVYGEWNRVFPKYAQKMARELRNDYQVRIVSSNDPQYIK